MHLTERGVNVQNSLGLTMSPYTIKLILHQRGNLAKSIGIIIVVFFICWMPDRVLFFLFQFLDVRPIEWNSSIYQIFVVLIFFSSSINPFIIAFRSEKFRSILKTIIFKKLKLARRIVSVKTKHKSKYRRLPSMVV